MTAQANPYSPRPALGCTDLSHRLPTLSERVRLDELADWNERNRLARVVLRGPGVVRAVVGVSSETDRETALLLTLVDNTLWIFGTDAEVTS